MYSLIPTTNLLMKTRTINELNGLDRGGITTDPSC